eukprot:403373326
MENPIVIENQQNTSNQYNKNQGSAQTITEIDESSIQETPHKIYQTSQQQKEHKLTLEEAKSLLDHQILPPIFIFQVKSLWNERFQAYIDQQASTNETSQEENNKAEQKQQTRNLLPQNSEDFQTISLCIQAKIYTTIQSLKDRSKCIREILHNFFSCILSNSDQMCLYEKIFYDQFMKVYPQNHRAKYKMNGYPPVLFMCLSQSKIFLQRFVPWFHNNKEQILQSTQSPHFQKKLAYCFDFVEAQIGFSMNIRLNQNSEGYQILLNQLRDLLISVKNPGEPIDRNEIGPQDQSICDHICKGNLHKPHSFNHRICQKGYKYMEEKKMIDKQYIQNWVYLMENHLRLFENSLLTQLPKDKIQLNNPIAQMENPITHEFFQAYQQVAQSIKNVEFTRQQPIQQQTQTQIKQSHQLKHQNQNATIKSQEKMGRLDSSDKPQNNKEMIKSSVNIKMLKMIVWTLNIVMNTDNFKKMKLKIIKTRMLHQRILKKKVCNKNQHLIKRLELILITD